MTKRLPAWVRVLLALILGASLAGAAAGPAAATDTGLLRICKVGTGPDVTGWFEFTVSTLPGQTFTVPVGQCSYPITAPVGETTVTELARTGYHLVSVTSLPEGSLISFDLSAQSATVTVVTGGSYTLRNLTFTNAPTPTVSGCTLTKGYWRTHPEAVAALLDGGTLMVGGTALTAAQIQQVMDLSAANYLNQVTQQLIAALLNQMSGASVPTDVQTAMAAAQLLIAQQGGPLGGTATSSTTVTYGGTTWTASQIVAVLSSYNEGTVAGGPLHCDG